MRKKLKSGIGIAALVAVMFVAPPAEWASASNHTWQDRQPIRTCLPYLNDGFIPFISCVIYVFRGGEIER